MKKIIAMALMMLLICACALAETTNIPETSLTLDIPSDYEIYELLSEDTEDDVVMHVGSADYSVEMYIYAFKNDGWTMEELVNALNEEDITDKSGSLDINGIAVAYRTFGGDDLMVVEYDTISDGNIVDIIFTAGGDSNEAKALIKTLA